MKNNVTRLAGLVLTFAASAVAFSISTAKADLSSVALFQAYGNSFGNAKQDATIVVQAANGNPIDVEINQDRRLASVRQPFGGCLYCEIVRDSLP